VSSQRQFCNRCGASILDGSESNLCAVCQAELLEAEAKREREAEHRSDWSERQSEVLFPPPPIEREPKKKRHINNFSLIWFLAGAVWFLIDLASIGDSSPEWNDWAVALSFETWFEFGLKTLGVLIAGPWLLVQISEAIRDAVNWLLKMVMYVAIGAVVAYLVFATNVLDTISDEIAQLGSETTQDEDAPEISSKDYESVQQLRLHVLNLINKDRADHGIDPVRLGTNAAAQSHANDMLAFGYLGHWWVDGRKPYMVYSDTGGTSYVAENVAVYGHKIAGFIDNDCDSLLSLCERLVPDERLEHLQWSMVYDDAESDWGHRETMLDPNHTEVSIGIAFDSEFIALAQHFSGDKARVLSGPSINSRTLSLTAEIDPDVAVLEVMPVWRESLPVERRPEDIAQLNSYCPGGDFSEECGDPLWVVYPPPPFGREYIDPPDNALVATVWDESDGVLEIEVVLPLFDLVGGVYTVALLEDVGEIESETMLLMLSTRFEG
jgi:uncharacterized protein YkwD